MKSEVFFNFLKVCPHSVRNQLSGSDSGSYLPLRFDVQKSYQPPGQTDLRLRAAGLAVQLRLSAARCQQQHIHRLNTVQAGAVRGKTVRLGGTPGAHQQLGGRHLGGGRKGVMGQK